ncbi:hypothetical protein ABZZ36_36690 [Actinacidiphila glaucinigra]|uniref:hypothetical protein n=1 Tax=Actinacidiphila glaucinigra TaxID=235986 RepID=UPI0033A354DF
MLGSFKTFLDTARIKELPQQKSGAGNHKNEPNGMQKRIWSAVNPVRGAGDKWLVSLVSRGVTLKDVDGSSFEEARVGGAVGPPAKTLGK